MVVHKHLMVRAEVREPITSERDAKDWLWELSKLVGMEICLNGGPHAHYVEKDGNYGIAAVAMIETSHISLHVWDREDPPLVQFDIYSCKDYDIKIPLGFVYKMKPTKIWYHVFDRGQCIQSTDNSFKDYTKKEPHIYDECLEWFF